MANLNGVCKSSDGQGGVVGIEPVTQTGQGQDPGDPFFRHWLNVLIRNGDSGIQPLAGSENGIFNFVKGTGMNFNPTTCRGSFNVPTHEQSDQNPVRFQPLPA